MTEPPENATLSAALSPERAAAAVRTLAAVAIRIPRKPARAEHAAPASSENPIRYELSGLPAFAQPNSTDATTTKIARTRYSRARNAMAP